MVQMHVALDLVSAGRHHYTGGATTRCHPEGFSVIGEAVAFSSEIFDGDSKALLLLSSQDVALAFLRFHADDTR